MHPRLGPASKAWMPGTKPGHDGKRVTGNGEVSLEAAAIIGRAEERSPNRESPSSSWPGFVPKPDVSGLGLDLERNSAKPSCCASTSWPRVEDVDARDEARA